MRLRPILLGLALLAATSVTPAAAAGGLDVRLGAFLPRAESNLFDDDRELYTVEKKDFVGFAGGAEYRFGVGGPVQIGLHVDGYSRTLHTSYREFVRQNGREIQQSLRLTIVPIGASIHLSPERGHSHSRVVPYVAVGVDAVAWNYQEEGDFVDFFSNDLDIVPDAFESEGVAFGVHAAAGLRVYVNDDVAISGEARYLAAKDDMGRDFRGNEIDLSGFQATVGVSLRF